MSNVFDVILLTALPASGKSEVRSFLANVGKERLQKEFHIGENLQLDDFPYVNFMRLIDTALAENGSERIFYASDEDPFYDSRDWGTLIQLLNEDYHHLLNREKLSSASPAKTLFERIDRAALAVGIPPRLEKLDDALIAKIAEALDEEALRIQHLTEDQYTEDMSDKTIIIELSRGGHDGASFPLQNTEGYQYSLPLFAPDLLSHAAVLYIRVDPEESRRKNAARFDPNDPQSSLHHMTPVKVMLNDYGCDDMPYLIEQSRKADSVTVNSYGNLIDLPAGVFDNRTDQTTFLREDPSHWDPARIQKVSDSLRKAADAMWAGYRH